LNPRTPPGVDLEAIRAQKAEISQNKPTKINITENHINAILNSMRIANRTEGHINRVERILREFVNAVNYECDFDDVVEFLELHKTKAHSYYRKYVTYVRKLLKEAGADFVDKIQLPKVPKRRREVVKRSDVKRLIECIRSMNFALPKQKLMQQRVIAGLLIMATSGLRSEELYNLSFDEIDIRNRIIRLKIGKTASGKTIKDYEERVTFFSEEAKQELLRLLDMWNDGKPLFNVRSFYSMWEYYLKDEKLKPKHMRKFFSQQSDRLGMPTAAKKILMGHSLRGDVDLSYYDFQDEEELKKIYDKYWKDFRILD